MHSRSQAPRSSRQAFVVRIWWEEDDTGAPTLLRGVVQVAHSQEETAFASLKELVLLLTSHFRPPHDDGRASDR